MKEQRAENIRQGLAEALAVHVKAQNLPATCLSLGLRDGTGEEAFRSKRSYVRDRVKALQPEELLAVAKKVAERFEDASLEALLDEHLVPVERRISELTRRKVLAALDGVVPLFGELGARTLEENLSVLAPDWDRKSETSGWETLRDDVDQHYLRNDDWSNSELLKNCGALSRSQDRFLELLERVLHPLCHQGHEQEALAEVLDALLKLDGYRVIAVGEESGHLVYGVRPDIGGVAGAPKNLIFASIGEKPEIVLDDSINNDIRITKHADKCLVFDQPIPREGLTWKELASWWQKKAGCRNHEEARKSLGERLRESVILVQSPGEYAIFQQYYQVMGPKLQDRLPALIPQVYLHFDPFTVRQRGGRKELLRQRMDFLLLLAQRVRIVIEVDGKHHYADEHGASPRRYAEMAAEDRALRLRGYEVYRFGAAEFMDVTKDGGRYEVGPNTKAMLADFFESLFARHKA